MSNLIPKYIGKLKNRTNKQLLAWQIFNFLKYTAVILVAILMARYVNDITLIKNYEKLILIGSSLTFFFVSGLAQTVIPFFESETEEKKQYVFKSFFFLLTALSLLSSAVLFSYGTFYEKENYEIYCLFALAIVFNVPTFAVESYYLGNKNQVRLVIWGILSFGIQVSFLLIPLLFFNSLLYGIIGYLVAAVLKFAFTLFTLKISFNEKTDKEQITRLAKSSFPIVLSFLIGNAYIYINAFIVENKLSEKEFVLYRYGAKEFPLFLIIANSFSLIYSGKISKAMTQNSLEATLLTFKEKSKKVMHQLFPFGILLTLCAQFLFRQFYSESFEDAYIVFNLLILFLFSRVLFPQTILFGIKKNKRFLLPSSLELISGVVLSLVLVAPLGLVGVCIAMVIAALIEKIILIVICYKESIQFFNYFPAKLYLLYISLLGLACAYSLNIF